LDGDLGDEAVVRTRSAITVVDGETGQVRWMKESERDFFACLKANDPHRLATSEGIWDFSKGFDRGELRSITWRPEAIVERSSGEQEFYAFTRDSGLNCYSFNLELRWSTEVHIPAHSNYKWLNYDGGSSRLYLSVGYGYPRFRKVYCADAKTGRIIWDSDISEEQLLIESSNPETPPRTAESYDTNTTVRELAAAIPSNSSTPVRESSRLSDTFRNAHKILPGAAFSVSPSPDGERLAVCHSQTGQPTFGQTISIVDTRSGTSTTINSGAAAPKWSPTGNAVLYSVGSYKSFNSTVWLYDVESQQHRQLANGELPTWSQDGKAIYYVHRKHSQPAEIQSLDLTNPEATPITLLTRPDWDVVAAVSPDKQHVALVEYEYDRGHLTIHRLGASPVLFERDYGFTGDIAIAWSPDSRRLALSLLDPPANPRPVWLIDVPTRRISTLWTGRVNNVSWWPDSKRLLFHIRGDQGHEAWLIDPAQRRPTASYPSVIRP
jgi:Tol biopolymer transport system component